MTIIYILPENKEVSSEWEDPGWASYLAGRDGNAERTEQKGENKRRKGERGQEEKGGGTMLTINHVKEVVIIGGGCSSVKIQEGTHLQSVALVQVMLSSLLANSYSAHGGLKEQNRGFWQACMWLGSLSIYLTWACFISD